MKLLSYMRTRLPRKTLMRYIISYLLVMLIPITALYLSFDAFYIRAYKNKIIEQYKEQLLRTEIAVETLYSNFQEVGSYCSLQKEFSDIYLLNNNIAFIGISKLLKSISASNAAIFSIHYYNFVTPDTIYTESGTYNMEYYKHFIVNGESLSLREYITGREKKAGWILPTEVERVINSGYAEKNIDFLLSINDSRSFILFSVEQDYLSGMIDGNISPIIFSFEKQIFPETKITSGDMRMILDFNEEDSMYLPDERLLLQNINELYGMKYSYIIPSSMIEANVRFVQRSLIILFFVFLLVGGLLVNLMCFISYKPIRLLKKSILGLNSTLPAHMDDIEAISFTIEDLEKRLTFINKNVLLEKLLIKLFHGMELGTETLETEFIRAGVSLSNMKEMRVILVQLAQGACLAAGGNIIGCTVDILNRKFCTYGMEYIESSCFLFLTGGLSISRHDIEYTLGDLETELSEKITGNYIIAISETCSNVAELSDRYRQVIAIPDRFPAKNIQVAFYEDIPDYSESLLYPKSEIDGYCDAIVSANSEKVTLLCDILINIIENHASNTFVATSLCYEILYSSIRAMDTLSNSANEAESIQRLYRILSKVLKQADLILEIIEVRDKILNLISEKYTLEKPEHMMVEICRYIHRHYNDPLLCVKTISNHYDISISNLSHQFKAQIGMNISRYISRVQLEYAKELLSNQMLNIAQIANAMGFTQTSSFIRKFKNTEGITPNEFREKNQICSETSS